MNIKRFLNMSPEEILYKAQTKYHDKKYTVHRAQTNYYSLYASYRYALAHPNVNGAQNNYFAARPNPGAGVGHQMANWIAGYWYAKQFGLSFAHIPFSNVRKPFSPNGWEHLLGFGAGETTVKQLTQAGYQKVYLPLFDEKNEAECSGIRNIIKAYSDKKVVFIAEQDQFYRDQFGVMSEIGEKFWNAPARAEDAIVYSEQNYNIAIHVRRGDIVLAQGEENENLSMRWIENDYFVHALQSTLALLKTNKPVHIYLFSQGSEADYAEFNQFENLHFCLDMSAEDSFLHMVHADALITSKSSFSYKPALLSKGIKICPDGFWHGYPQDKNWILLNEKGALKA